MTTKQFIELPGLRQAYMATLTPIIPEYKPISIAHAVVSEGGKTLRMSGWPAIGPNGIIGKGWPRAPSRFDCHASLTARAVPTRSVANGGHGAQSAPLPTLPFNSSGTRRRCDWPCRSQ